VVVVRSRVIGIAGALVAASIAAVFAVVILAVNKLTLTTALVSAAGFSVAAIVLIDYPLWSSFNDLGLVRCTASRCRQIAWADVASLSRVHQRPGLRPDPATPYPTRPGGLVVAVGRRRLWLCDTVEDLEAFHRISTFAAMAGVAVVATEPMLGVSRS
jgi:hypothetical protein